MRQISFKKIYKLWGYEIWLYSPLKGNESTLEDGSLITKGPLIKIIKANMPLSIQVHPDDKFALELENQLNGKSESWYILDHEKDASLVIGLKDYNPELIRSKLNDLTFEDLLLKVKVQKGEFYNIPAGLVHGIGKGIKVLEVQQPSDTTYRYFDYNRLENGKPRELHVDKAIKVQKDLSYKLEPKSTSPLVYENEVGLQAYLNKPMRLLQDAIIVDLDKEIAYLGSKDEIINLSNYVIVTI